MDKRSFLFGLGIGIIVGALLLQLITLGNESKEKLNEKAQQINSADVLGVESDQQNADGGAGPIVVGQDNDQDKSMENDQAKSKDNDHNEENKQIEEQPDLEELSDMDGSKADETENASSDNDAASSDMNTYSIIRIKPGYTLSLTADYLHELKVLEQTGPFVETMKKKVNGSTRKVRAGCFLVHEGMNAKEVVDVVTSKPLTKSEARAHKAKNAAMSIDEICL